MAGNDVLVAVGPNDGERAGRLAETTVKLAGDEGAVDLFHVFAAEDADQLASMLDIDPREPEQLSVAVSRNEAVDAVAEGLRAAGVRPTFRGAFGEPGEEVVDATERTAPDFVVVGGRKRSPTGKALFGSTAQQVLLSAPAPVVFVRPPAE